MAPPGTSADPAGLLGRMLDDRYQAVAYVGAGQLGYVYRGELARLHRTCALKVLRPEVQDDPAHLQRVIESSQRISRGRFDALVLADDVVTVDGRTTLVMPWLSGDDLATTLEQTGRLAWARARELLLQLGAGLGELHTHGLVFPGLKPRNIFLVRASGDDTVVKLLDVGLSRHDPATRDIAYMAPEWIAGAEPNARTDLYNLAAIACEALTGVPAFQGPVAQISMLKRHKGPPGLRSLAADVVVPARVEALLVRALDRDPQVRPSLDSLLAAVTEARDDGPVPEENVTQFFRRASAMPASRTSQSGELRDELHVTGQYRRTGRPGEVPTTIDLSHPVAPRASVHVPDPCPPTRVNNPVVPAARPRHPFAANPDVTHTRNPIVPAAAHDRPAPPAAESTRLHNPIIPAAAPAESTRLRNPIISSAESTRFHNPVGAATPESARLRNPIVPAAAPLFEPTRVQNPIVGRVPEPASTPRTASTPDPTAHPRFASDRPAQPRTASTPDPTAHPRFASTPEPRFARATEPAHFAAEDRTSVSPPPAAPESTQALPQLERTVFLAPLDSTTRLPAGMSPETAARTGHSARTAMIAGFGGSFLGDGTIPTDAALVVADPPPRRWPLLDRLLRLFRRDPSASRKPGLWQRLTGARGNLPARRGPTGFDRFLRRLAEIPSMIGRGWRFALRPFSRLTGLKSRMMTPLMVLRTAIARIARIFSRWTGGGA